MHKMIKLTNKHKKHGYYKLPGVNRPINPRDPFRIMECILCRTSRIERRKYKTKLSTGKYDTY